MRVNPLPFSPAPTLSRPRPLARFRQWPDGFVISQNLVSELNRNVRLMYFLQTNISSSGNTCLS
ncbi:hypothetical protein MUK42_35024 [Musa troglodytarum]|uniref:Uncharacterized protein n=1 Tax=Musa troglodytarum TaxID=320322 RepID=A0A9E7JAF3_9LILI|nr:hypothetical protein MUK42_35024 [Musa troglodytarum]